MELLPRTTAATEMVSALRSSRGESRGVSRGDSHSRGDSGSDDEGQEVKKISALTFTPLRSFPP